MNGEEGNKRGGSGKGLVVINLTIFIFQKSKSALEEPAKSPDGETEYESSASLVEDVLIKLIRVIANLSINQDIGPLIASNENCVDQLMQILGENYFRAMGWGMDFMPRSGEANVSQRGGCFRHFIPWVF